MGQKMGSNKYYGPYQVIKRIIVVAYKLTLPEENSVHLVFHVSLLKKKVGNVAIVSSILLEVDETSRIIICHVAILDRSEERV